MVFLRELAQNARDAGASRIDVRTRLKDDALILTFADNGRGMDFEHAQKFLFTLYASSKEDEVTSAGRFGVGFWAVLLIKPSLITIESRTRAAEQFGMAIDGGLEQHRPIPCELKRPGTRIRLQIPVRNDQEAERTQIEMRLSLSRYCRYLRQADRKNRPLPIYYNKAEITEEFSLDGPCWMPFRTGSVEGAVGLGERPRVDLYARGLLVWHGTVLDELRCGVSKASGIDYPEGLAPVYLLNGNRLNVTLDRRAVVDDRALARVRRIARRQMRTLIRIYLDNLYPRTAGRRLIDFLLDVIDDLRLKKAIKPVAVVGLVALVICCAGLITYSTRLFLEHRSTISAFGSSPGGEGTVGSSMFTYSPIPIGKPLSFSGPVVNPSMINFPTTFAYRPPEDVNFRLTVAENLDAGRGILGVLPVPRTQAPNYRCNKNCLEVSMKLEPGVRHVVIPVPTGYLIDASSVRLNRRPITGLRFSAAGEPMIVLDKPTGGVLAYRTGPRVQRLKTKHQRRLLVLPEKMTLPKELEEVVHQAAREPTTAATVERIRRFVEYRLHYDRSESAARTYAAFLTGNPTQGWLDFVLDIGVGDCDVKNTVAIAMLRRASIPARLAVGLVGREGRAASELHAWIEYRDKRWKTIDATGTSQSPRPPGTFTHTPEPPLADSSPVPSSADRPLELGLGLAAGSAVGSGMIIAGLAAAFILGLAVLLHFTRRGKRVLFTVKGIDEQHKVAAKMVTDILLRPQKWIKRNGLAKRRLLPLLGPGRRMISLTQALAMGRKGTLWFSQYRTRLVKHAVKNGALVLNAADEAFGKLIRQLPGALDLGEVALIKPLPTHELPPQLKRTGRLLGEVNTLLAQCGLPLDLVRPCLKLKTLSRDIDLSELKLGGLDHWPSRFIAVSVHDDKIKRIAELGEEDLRLSAFFLIDVLLSRSSLLRKQQDRIRRLTARQVIEEW